MEKYSISTVDKTALPILGKKDSQHSLQLYAATKHFALNLYSDVSTLLFNFHLSRQKHYKKVMDKLNGQIAATTPPSTQSMAQAASISEEIWDEIVVKLEEFELNKGYLDADISLNSLSKKMGTNHSYLSKIINTVKEKSFKNYLNDLRIVHARERISSDPNLRKYTIEAIAFDNGFKSAESFSKKFKEMYAIYPSKYLKSLETKQAS